jgi:hypothetical protein
MHIKDWSLKRCTNFLLWTSHMSELNTERRMDFRFINVQESYYGSAGFETRSQYQLSLVRFLWFSFVYSEKFWSSVCIRPRPFPSKSYFITRPSFDVIESAHRKQNKITRKTTTHLEIKLTWRRKWSKNNTSALKRGLERTYQDNVIHQRPFVTHLKTGL